MSLQTRLEAVIAAIGADVKALQESSGGAEAVTWSGRVGSSGTTSLTTVGVAPAGTSWTCTKAGKYKVQAELEAHPSTSDRYAFIDFLIRKNTVEVRATAHYINDETDSRFPMTISQEVTLAVGDVVDLWVRKSGGAGASAFGNANTWLHVTEVTAVGPEGPAGSATASSYMDIQGEYTTGSPTAPTVGSRLFTRVSAGRRLPAWIGPSGLDVSIQPHFGTNKISMYAPVGGSGTALATTIAWNTGAVGTAVARSVANTSYWAATRRIGYTTAATLNAACGVRSANASFMYSSSPGRAGFHAIFRFGIQTYQPGGARLFVGLSNSTGALSATSEISALVNMLGVGKDTADTNLQIFSNNGAGTAVKVDLGSSFPANTSQTDVYEFRVFVAPGSTDIFWEVVRLNTGHTTSGLFNSDRPSEGVALAPHFHMATASAASCGLDIMGAYVETDQ